MQLEGLDKLVAWLQAKPHQVINGIKKGVYRHANVVMAKSQEIVPIGGPPTSPFDPAPGTLKASGTVGLPEVNGSLITCEIGYGGAASEYAIQQHERLDFQHKPGTSAKYLERPFVEEAENLLGRVAEGIQEELS